MKKINNYSTQYKIIHELAPATANAQNFTHSSATANAQSFTEQLHNQNHGKNTTKAKPYLHKKTLSKDRQEFINNISASGFKQFNL